jgi:hypothetical protein
MLMAFLHAASWQAARNTTSIVIMGLNCEEAMHQCLPSLCMWRCAHVVDWWVVMRLSFQLEQ